MLTMPLSTLAATDATVDELRSPVADEDGASGAVTLGAVGAKKLVVDVDDGARRWATPRKPTRAATMTAVTRARAPRAGGRGGGPAAAGGHTGGGGPRARGRVGPRGSTDQRRRRGEVATDSTLGMVDRVHFAFAGTRVLVSAVAGVVVFAVAATVAPWPAAVLLGWDTSAAVFLAWVLWVAH